MILYSAGNPAGLLLWDTEDIMTKCSSCHHQWLLSEPNPGLVDYKPSALTFKPRSFFSIKTANCENSCSLIINFDLLVSPAPFKDIRINEVNVDTVGFKDKGEYIELIG